MGVFDDKKFEQLDWMSQMTETIESEVNGLLARLPDRLELDLDNIVSFMNAGYTRNTLTPGNVARHLLQTIPDKHRLSWDDSRRIESCFSLEVSEDLVLDLEKNEMVGKVFLVKTTPTLDDETLQEYMGSEGLQLISSINKSEASLGRANDVMELLGGLEDQIRARSLRNKIHGIRNRLQAIFKNNEWRIRDTALANKVGRWISEYIQTGNLAAYSNFCKLKVMTHQNMPIYSIEEQE